MFAGKSYSIFALLFGFTFHVQYTNQQFKGKDFGYRFLWRLLLLTGFDTINASFFPGGDVLLLYAVVGVSLFLVRKWSDKAILITAIILLCQPIEWYHYVSGLLDPAYRLPDLGVVPLYEEVIGNTREGKLGKFIIGNLTTGQMASFLWAVGTGRFLQTAGLFMIGLLLGRKLLFVSTENNIRFWVKVLIASAIVFNPLYVLKVQVFDNGSSDMIKQTAGVVFDMWQKLAFTFGMASSRFDTRRQLVIEEANDIGTVILRTDFFPDSTRRLLRNSLQEYVEARIGFYQAGMDMDKTVAYYIKADSLSRQAWNITTRYARQDNITVRMSELVPALNAMIDITTTRRAAGEATIPDSIMYFLFVLCFCSAFLLGYDNKHKIDWIVVSGFAVMLSVTVLTILDLDRPRGGFINMDTPNQKIIELREMFKQ